MTRSATIKAPATFVIHRNTSMHRHTHITTTYAFLLMAEFATQTTFLDFGNKNSPFRSPQMANIVVLCSSVNVVKLQVLNRSTIRAMATKFGIRPCVPLGSNLRDSRTYCVSLFAFVFVCHFHLQLGGE